MQLGIRLIANGQCPVHRYWEHLLDLIRKGDIEPLDMVTHRVRLEEMAKLYDLFSKRKMGMQKVFVETRNSAAPTPGTPQLIELWEASEAVYCDEENICIALASLLHSVTKQDFWNMVCRNKQMEWLLLCFHCSTSSFQRILNHESLPQPCGSGKRQKNMLGWERRGILDPKISVPRCVMPYYDAKDNADYVLSLHE